LTVVNDGVFLNFLILTSSIVSGGILPLVSGNIKAHKEAKTHSTPSQNTTLAWSFVFWRWMVQDPAGTDSNKGEKSQVKYQTLNQTHYSGRYADESMYCAEVDSSKEALQVAGH